MSHEPPPPEPTVTRSELRAALARGETRSPRRVALVSPPAPAWDWHTPDTDAELQGLRDEIAQLEAQLDETRRDRRLAGRREEDLRSALRAVATAPLWRRRRVVSDLRAEGLLR